MDINTILAVIAILFDIISWYIDNHDDNKKS